MWRNLTTAGTKLVWAILPIFIVMNCLSCCGPSGPTSEQLKSQFESKMQSWVGRDANDLIRSWGYPQKVGDMPNGNKMFTYIKAESVQKPVVTIPGQQGFNRTAPTYAIGGGTDTWYCAVSYEVDSGSTIVYGRYEGNNCW
jgi:hypothetical protein